MALLLRSSLRVVVPLLCLLAWTRAAVGDELPRDPDPLVNRATAGVSAAEIAILAQISVANVYTVIQRPYFEGRLDRPTIPPDFFGSWDVRVSDLVYTGPEPLHGGFPVYLGTGIMPAVFLAFYISNAASEWASGRSWTDRVTHRHSPPGKATRLFWGALETASWSIFLQQAMQSAIRRDRPAEILLHGNDIPFGGHLSFYSGHASLAVAIAAYGSLHIGDVLNERLRRLHPVPRALVAWGLPSLVLYGMAGYVGYSRLHDQQHFLSDVLIGSVIGGGIGNFFYFWHTRGPHVRRYVGRVVPQAGGAAYQYVF